MDMGIAGRWALVCAASKGLGRACAIALANEGVDVVITARGAEALAKTAQEWNWPARVDTARLKLAAADRCPAWGADRLWAAALKTGDAAQIFAGLPALATA